MASASRCKEQSVKTDARTDRQWVESLYERLVDEDEGRVCEPVPDEACRAVPGNFFRILAAGLLTSVGDKLSSAKTTLPWLLNSTGAPAWMLAALVPLRESGSMLPQLLLGASVRAAPVRKWVWSAGSAVQGVALAAMAWSALALDGAAAGWWVLGWLVLFSLSRGACSIAHKDVIGKTIPKSGRGRLSGWIMALAGAGSLAAGAVLGLVAGNAPAWWLGGILGVAALMWFVAAWVFATVHEPAGETDGGANALGRAFARLALLRDDRPFRRFVISRALAMGSGLAAPFYVALATGHGGGGAALLGIFIAAEGIAGLASAPVWGKFADRSSRLVFATASALAGTVSLVVAVMAFTGWHSPGGILVPVAFFVLGVAHTGVRLGRKTYLLNLGEGNRRTDYVAVSNTVMGALLLVAGAAGGLLSVWSPAAALAFFGTTGLAATALALRLPEK